MAIIIVISQFPNLGLSNPECSQTQSAVKSRVQSNSECSQIQSAVKSRVQSNPECSQIQSAVKSRAVPQIRIDVIGYLTPYFLINRVKSKL